MRPRSRLLLLHVARYDETLDSMMSGDEWRGLDEIVFVPPMDTNAISRFLYPNFSFSANEKGFDDYKIEKRVDGIVNTGEEIEETKFHH